MAHSFISARKNSNKERLVAVPDGALTLFMYFFNEVAEQNIRPNSTEEKICEHYKLELLEVHSTFMDAMLEVVSEDKKLRLWYLSMLVHLRLRLDNFGEYIDNNYLNRIPELLIGYPPDVLPWSRPIAVSLITNLINDIYWVLDEKGYTPSGQFKWFEENTK